MSFGIFAHSWWLSIPLVLLPLSFSVKYDEANEIFRNVGVEKNSMYEEKKLQIHDCM